jgi:hypothetical protein
MASLHGLELKAYYQCKRAEGKHHEIALGAVCCKLLACFYIVLKERGSYVI